MQHTLRGEIAQTLEVSFGQDEFIWASKGSIVTMGPGVDWHLKVPGGVGGAAKRMLSGEGASLSYITTQQPSGRVVLAANRTGKIATWDLASGPVVCTAGSFLAAVGDVDISITIARKAGALFFGGAGLILQRISGQGRVFIHGAGDFIDYDLAPGEPLTISSGNLAAFAGSVDYNIKGVGGCIKMIFGREGMFMTQMTGPGRVLVQSMKGTIVSSGR